MRVPISSHTHQHSLLPFYFTHSSRYEVVSPLVWFAFPCWAMILNIFSCACWPFEYWLDGLLLKLKLQYSDHLMQRANSLEMTLMLGKIKGKRSGRKRMRWLDSITNSMDMSLNKLWEIVKDSAAVLWSMGLQRIKHNLPTEQWAMMLKIFSCACWPLVCLLGRGLSASWTLLLWILVLFQPLFYRWGNRYGKFVLLSQGHPTHKCQRHLNLFGRLGGLKDETVQCWIKDTLLKCLATMSIPVSSSWTLWLSSWLRFI